MTADSAPKPAKKPRGKAFSPGYDPRRWLSGRGKKSPEQREGDEILRAVIWEELSREFDTAGPVFAGEPITLCTPRGEAAEEIWPARAGDERVSQDIAAALGPRVRARRSSLFFDGGDFLAAVKNVLVVPRVLQRNIQQTVKSRGDFLRILTSALKRKVILLSESPDHHAGMFVASVRQQHHAGG